MDENEKLIFFAGIWEIWRDITAIEFLMRCAIAKKDKDDYKFPNPPYTKNKIYPNPPKSFLHSSFTIIVNKFNKRFPEISIPIILIELRNAMAHWLIVEIDDRGFDELVKFNKIEWINEIQVESNIKFDLITVKQIWQSIKELRKVIINALNNP